MGGDSSNGEQPRQARRVQVSRLLGIATPAFYLPQTADSRALDGLLGDLDRKTARRAK